MYIGEMGRLGIHGVVDDLLLWSIHGQKQAAVEVSVGEDRGIRIRNDGAGPSNPGQLTSIVENSPPFILGFTFPFPAFSTEADPTARWAGPAALPLVVANEMSERFVLTAGADNVQVDFRLDPQLFGSEQLQFEALRTRIRELAFLHPSVAWTLIDERSGNTEDFAFPGGLEDYVAQLALEMRISHTNPDNPLRLRGRVDYDDNSSVGVDTAVLWTHRPVNEIRSYVDGHRTLGGGTHVHAFQAALNSATARVASGLGTGIVAIIDVHFISSVAPHFEGATKDCLADERGHAVSAVVMKGIEHAIADGALDTSAR
jgi:DNA gyrase/topoisomerase IV subunit B